MDSANNLSDDTTDAAYNAEDMGQNLNDSSALTGKTLAQIDFVSTSAGSEDLHLDSDSVCRQAGVDLGTTNGVDIDIDGLTEMLMVLFGILVQIKPPTTLQRTPFLMFVD